MDKNQATGLFLISALLLVYLFFFAPKKPADKPAAKATSTSAAAKTDALTASAPLDSATAARTLGAFAAAAQGTAQQVQLQNPNLTVTFSTKGGRIEAVRLNKYKTFFGKPMDLLDAQSAQLDLSFRTTTGQKIRLSDLYFQPTAVVPATIGERKGQRITFTADVAGGRVEQVYTLLDDAYELGYNLRMPGLTNTLAQEPLTFTFVDRVRQTEQDAQQNRNHSTVNHYLATEDHGALAEASENPEEIVASAPVKWAAHKHDFFVAGLIADNQFTTGKFNSRVDLGDSTFLKTMSTTLTIPVADVQQDKAGFRYYFGPNSFPILKKVTPEFERNVYLGWGIFRWVNQFVVLPVFHFLEQFIGSYGVIIAILVLIIKLVTWPLTYKTYVSQAKMKVLKPELDELKAKYPDDPTKVQSETMKIYSAFGVSPLSGCVPTLLTIPILLAMFQFFPNAIELRQEHFLWAKDLSSYDVFLKLPFYIKWYGDHVSLFTLLMTASTLLMTWQSSQTNSQMQGQMKVMGYAMPIVYMFVLNSFAAGLTWYYFVSNMITFGQQFVTKAFVDETKLRAQLEANKVKNKDKKPGGFQARLAEAMKNAQEREAQAKQGGNTPAADKPKKPTRRS
ncbi:YidC/Oxa1 family membrane protein insertase [Hymenobacter daecheongensis DSM 21074]|uniref:Membrane protein insertase YidC n=1 Tax=Hymenobacter daecheongensis DSM 21074 TaxID=1121955 RepID=A0A1M6C2K6_9BACT|nr:membrane protein insertase YidC [Hymenobacter daecheongensis]SHI55182.1 YidC/Oxa1 family membrane protein insertase [Hymenobacter daecheongensis DSM 21074]